MGAESSHLPRLKAAPALAAFLETLPWQWVSLIRTVDISYLINTSLQRGDCRELLLVNRFNGFT